MVNRRDLIISKFSSLMHFSRIRVVLKGRRSCSVKKIFLMNTTKKFRDAYLFRMLKNPHFYSVFKT